MHFHMSGVEVSLSFIYPHIFRSDTIIITYPLQIRRDMRSAVDFLSSLIDRPSTYVLLPPSKNFIEMMRRCGG